MIVAISCFIFSIVAFTIGCIVMLIYDRWKRKK